MEITSEKNPRLKKVEKLKNRRERKKTDRFFIEGYREIKRCIEAGYDIEEFYYCPALFLKSNEEALIKKSQAETFQVKESLFRKLSYRDRPDGLIAVAPQRHLSLNDLSLSKNPFFIIAESIEKPGNLGTIIRSADAAGVDGVIVTDPCTDIHNPNVVRASTGTLFTVPVVEATNGETAAFLKQHEIQTVSATPHTEKIFTEEDLSQSIAVLVGSEQYGLTDEWLKESQKKVKIPMHGVADSLNVAQATTLLLYEIVRQRNS